MTTLMKFVKGATTLQFEEGASYPAARPIEKIQVTDRTASGGLQIEELGITLRTRVLFFKDMLKSDHDALLDWFDNVANASANSFEFTDERGFVGEVRILDNKFNSVEGDFELYNVDITVEYQS